MTSSNGKNPDYKNDIDFYRISRDLELLCDEAEKDHSRSSVSASVPTPILRALLKKYDPWGDPVKMLPYDPNKEQGITDEEFDEIFPGSEPKTT